MSTSLIAVQPKGIELGVDLLLNELLTLQRLPSDSAWYKDLFSKYNEAEIQIIRQGLSNTQIEAIYSGIAPLVGTAEWKNSFWYINYLEHEGKFFYNNFHKMLSGSMVVFKINSLLRFEDMQKVLKLLKGNVGLVSTVNGEVKRLRLGLGIRGLVDSEVFFLNASLLNSGYLQGELTKDTIDYISQINTPLLLSDIPNKIAREVFEKLPQQIRDNYNSCIMHTVDDESLISESISWLESYFKVK